MSSNTPTPNDLAVILQDHFSIGGVEAVVAYIQSIEDSAERRKLYSLAQRTFGRAEAPDLDALITIVRAGIQEGLSQAKETNTAEETDKLKDYANILSYNLSADLAECWPNDHTPRERRHFEAGLAAAEDCLRWRAELKKGPGSFSIAWWAKGAHCLSLGRNAEAAESFRHSLDYAIQNATTLPPRVEPGGDFSVILATGYLGLAQIYQDQGDARQTLYDQACAAFYGSIELGPEVATDARFGLDQLQSMQARLEARSSP